MENKFMPSGPNEYFEIFFLRIEIKDFPFSNLSIGRSQVFDIFREKRSTKMICDLLARSATPARKIIALV